MHKKHVLNEVSTLFLTTRELFLLSIRLLTKVVLKKKMQYNIRPSEGWNKDWREPVMPIYTISRVLGSLSALSLHKESL